MIELAKAIATRVHKGQMRSQLGQQIPSEYIEHPERVAAMVEYLGGSEEAQAVARLHDTLEDQYSEELEIELRDAFSPQVFNHIIELTRKEDEIYLDYISRINSDIGKLIKICDIVDNLSDNPSLSQKARYAKALKILSGLDDAST